MKPAIRSAGVGLCLFALAIGARAAVAPWDQAEVTALAKQLEAATAELSDVFRRQPRPDAVGGGQARPFWRLDQEIRRLRREAGSLSRELQRGAGRDQTLSSFESLMSTVRAARQNARRVFTRTEVQERAEAALKILNQLAPFYDPDFEPLAPVGR